MKLFQQLLLAPAALGLVAPMGAMAADLNLDGVNKYAASEEQVTSISQFSDVYPTDWAYQALANLIERYGCVAGYPNGTFGGNRAMSRYEAAALLNACLDRVTEMTDEIKRLVKAFEKELSIVKARVDGLEAKVGELEATQFSTTTKLKGKVRFVMGMAYRGDGMVRFGNLSKLIKAAKQYGPRVYDGYSSVQDASINGRKPSKSVGTAYYYYRYGTAFGNDGTLAANGSSVGNQANAGMDSSSARQVAFSTSWTGLTPQYELDGSEVMASKMNTGNSLYTLNANGTINSSADSSSDGVGGKNTYIISSLQGGRVGDASTLFSPDKSRLSVYFKDPIKSDNSFYIPGETASPDTQVLIDAEGVRPIGSSAYLNGKSFYLRDKYGGNQKFRVQNSASTSSNFKSKTILMDRADYGALVNLANKSRKVKAYSYYVFTNNDNGNGATSDTTAGLALVSKAAGVPDPIRYQDVLRGYVATTGQPVNNTNGAILSGKNKFVVTPGGFGQNNTSYSNVANYLIAEYGSLSESQRNTPYVKKAAQALVRSLAASPANTNRVADKNAFTFAHDAQLNFNTSFTGKDVLNFRIRSNTIYGFGKRVNAPYADLAFDGSKPKSAKAKLYLDKLYYRFPVGDWGVIAAGTRAPQSKFTTRGSMYNKDSLLEFFNNAAGVYPSYTGAGAGIQIGQLGGKKSKMKKGTFAFGIGYLANEKQAMNPDSYNAAQYGLVGTDTSFRVPVQLAWKSSDKKWLATLNYAYERGGNTMGKVGTELSSNPFGYKSLMESNQYGLTLAYKWSKQASITAAWGGASISSRYDSTALGIKMTDEGDTAQLNSWMVGFSFKDVFMQGNKAGFAIGGVPTVTSNNSGWGTDKSSPIALETWYQFQVTDNISVTPGVFWISGQQLENDNAGNYGGKFDDSNGNVWGGIIKTELKF